MKKIMIALTAVALAAGVQAASVTWCYDDNTELWDYLGAKVYAIAGTEQTTWASLAAVQAAAMSIDGSGTVEDQIVFANTGDIASADKNLTKSSGYYFVVVSADEKKYGTYAGNNYYVYDPEAQESYSETFSFSTDNVVPTKGWASPGPTPTPEPTSAMLLLLGVAGLALRRKQK